MNIYIYIYIYNRGTGPRHNFGKPASPMGVALLLPAPFELQKLCRKSSVGKTAHEVQNGGPVDLRIRNKSGKVRSGRRAFHRCLKHMKIEGLRPSKKRCFSLKGVQISLCPPLSKRHTEFDKNTFENVAEINTNLVFDTSSKLLGKTMKHCVKQ